MYCEIYLRLPGLGAKYKFAQQWQIYCVSPQWLYDSAERGYCQSEEPYSVDAAATGTGGSGGGRQKTDKGIRSTTSTQVQWNLSNLDMCSVLDFRDYNTCPWQLGMQHYLLDLMGHPHCKES